MAYDPTTSIGQVRLLCSDTQLPPAQVFTDAEITAFLALEGDNVKRAAAQAIDTIADDEALTSKVIKDHDLATDGAKVADSLRVRATALRAQADRDDEKNDTESFFEVLDINAPLDGSGLGEWVVP